MQNSSSISSDSLPALRRSSHRQSHRSFSGAGIKINVENWLENSKTPIKPIQPASCKTQTHIRRSSVPLNGQKSPMFSHLEPRPVAKVAIFHSLRPMSQSRQKEPNSAAACHKNSEFNTQSVVTFRPDAKLSSLLSLACVTPAAHRKSQSITIFEQTKSIQRINKKTSKSILKKPELEPVPTVIMRKSFCSSFVTPDGLATKHVRFVF